VHRASSSTGVSEQLSVFSAIGELLSRMIPHVSRAECDGDSAAGRLITRSAPDV
jgi:hypothetical protein